MLQPDHVETLTLFGISGGDGRGGQQGPQAHFALAPGKYRVEVRYSSGTTQARDITVGAAAIRAAIGQQWHRQ